MTRRVSRRDLDPLTRLRIELCELNGAPNFEEWANGPYDPDGEGRRPLMAWLPALVVVAVMVLVAGLTGWLW